MTRDVLVTISGMQFDVEDEPIELITAGTYYLRNGKHYVLYEEQPEDNGIITKNIVKLQDGYFEMIKKGGNNSCLLFEKGKKTSTIYQTLIGPIRIDVFTHEFCLSETEQELQAVIKYTLDINYNFVSECEVHFKVQMR